MIRRSLLLALCCTVVHAQPVPSSDATLNAWSLRFTNEVDHQLLVPADVQKRYTDLLAQELGESHMRNAPPQAYVLVDRSAFVQAAFVVVRTSAGWHWLGATAVSTGKTGTYEHFLTPLGVFAHTLDNPDFRAEGTYNQNKIRGYGLKGMRVFDFGWQTAQRGWGDDGESQMRFQMHATDPNGLEARLGSVQSEGCVRIPASLNRFLDRYGVLDAQYEEAAASGKKLWILRPDRQTMPWPGRYLVVVDSGATERPVWSPKPIKR